MLIHKNKFTRETADEFSGVPGASQISLLLMTDNQNLQKDSACAFCVEYTVIGMRLDN